MDTWRQSTGHIKALQDLVRRYGAQSSDASVEALVTASSQRLLDLELMLTELEIHDRRETIVSRLRRGPDPTADAALTVLSDRAIRRLQSRAIALRNLIRQERFGEVT